MFYQLINLLSALAVAGTPGEFVSANRCAGCHVTQHREWRGSMMHYGAVSPTFQAFELSVRKLAGRFGREDGENPTFCINCHSPIAAYGNDMAGLPAEAPAADQFSAVAKEGISCTFCHSTIRADREPFPDKGLLGDGIANASLVFFPTLKLIGPTVDAPLPQKNAYHRAGFAERPEASRFLRSSAFCGSCHDVRLPQTPDRGEKAPFQRLENLFTEWEQSPYNSAKNRYGKSISCQDCHMSLYGNVDSSTGKSFPPATYPEAPVADGYDIVRRHAIHHFTAVSTALVDSPEFSLPEQAEKRTALLRVACDLNLGKTPYSVTTSVLPVEVIVTNNGAGHRVPSGFSQEREVWLSLVLRDNRGRTVFESGTLVDRPHPDVGEREADGNLEDEDLEDTHVELDDRFEMTRESVGRDFNFRPWVDYGVPRFNNAFLRQRRRVHGFFLPDRIDNRRSLPVLVPVPLHYRIPRAAVRWPRRGRCETITVVAELKYRTFPPSLLRVLARREPALVSEALIDRNRVVTMATVKRRISWCAPEVDPPADFGTDRDENAYWFHKDAVEWRGYLDERPWAEAAGQCRLRGCRLPTKAELRTIVDPGRASALGENHDEWIKERWTGEPAVGAERRSFFCRCDHPQVGATNGRPE